MMNSLKSAVHKHTDTHKLPVRGASWQNLSALLRVSHTVYRLLWILTFCYGGDLKQTNKQSSKPDRNAPNRPSHELKDFTVANVKHWKNTNVHCVCVCVFTCTAWTCGDWITDGCAAWMTPWTWTVCPLGSCTSVTVGPVAEAWPVVMDTWNSDVTLLSAKYTLKWTIFFYICGIQNQFFSSIWKAAALPEPQ